MCGAVVLLTLYAEKLHDGRRIECLHVMLPQNNRVSFLVNTGDGLNLSHINGNYKLCGI